MNDKRHGQGQHLFQDGSSFVGIYVNDLKNGEGVSSQDKEQY